MIGSFIEGFAVHDGVKSWYKSFYSTANITYITDFLKSLKFKVICHCKQGSLVISSHTKHVLSVTSDLCCDTLVKMCLRIEGIRIITRSVIIKCCHATLRWFLQRNRYNWDIDILTWSLLLRVSITTVLGLDRIANQLYHQLVHFYLYYSDPIQD